jgi:N-acylneuraminate cytidylyltransferase
MVTKPGRFLGLIPARGGSKGVPRKNLRVVEGKSLLGWTIDEAKKSKYLDAIVLSSDDAEIITEAKQCGCEVPFVRPPELARDETPGIEPVLHALKELPEFDYIVLLQPTSPLRSVDDIDGCIERFLELKAPSCVSVCESPKNPLWMFTLDADYRMTPLLEGARERSRQELPKTWVLNGAVYVARREFVMQQRGFISDATVAYQMPIERSLDIDTELDLIMLKAILESRRMK